MTRHRSIRFRLALWYSCMLSVGLVVLGSVLWLGWNHAMLAGVDQRLTDRLSGLVKTLTHEAEVIRQRVRGVIQNPELATSLLPEYRAEIQSLSSEGDRERFVSESLRRFTESQMKRLAASLPEGEFLEIRNARGQLVAATAHPRAGEPVAWPAPAELLKPRFLELRIGGQGYRALAQVHEVDGRPYQFFTATSLGPMRAVRSGMLSALGWGLPLFLALSALGGYLISSRALRPVDRITRAAQSISIRDLSHRLEVPRTGDELERLAETWNAMLERLESAVNRLAQFTADASHELRTPTAAIATTAELALRRERSREEYQDALRKIEREAGRMTRLVEDLLTLARADTGLETLPMAPLDLTQLVRDVCSDYRILAEARGLRCECAVPTQELHIPGHEGALRRLLIVLLDNAIQYTAPGGAIHVSLADGAREIQLEVQDTGVGIPSEAIPRIFDRFYRVDPSRSRRSGGFGLGLSVARWVADKHHAKIEVTSAEGRGSVFRVRIPVQEVKSTCSTGALQT